jgi:hypothetical protein
MSQFIMVATKKYFTFIKTLKPTMKNSNHLMIAVFAIFILACSADKKTIEDNSSKTAQTEDWFFLLQNNSLDQWQMFSGGEMNGWEVIDNELRASGAGWDANQDIITKNEYENFELSLEWKIESTNSSGIFYLVGDSSAGPIYESAPEYQVMDDAGWPEKMKPNQYTGGTYAMYAPEGGQVKPVGEWNTTRIVVDIPHVEHWLNNVKVVEYELWSDDWRVRKSEGKWAEVPNYGLARSGHIGLQNAGKVVYRNIKVRQL